MTSVRPLSCREESRDGSWNTNTVTTSVAKSPKERDESRGREKKGNHNPEQWSQISHNIDKADSEM